MQTVRTCEVLTIGLLCSTTDQVYLIRRAWVVTTGSVSRRAVQDHARNVAADADRRRGRRRRRVEDVDCFLGHDNTKVINQTAIGINRLGPHARLGRLEVGRAQLGDQALRLSRKRPPAQRAAQLARAQPAATRCLKIWEAHAFAMAVRLSEAGIFTWAEWAEALGAEITAARERGDPDLGDSYYRHWLKALEVLVTGKGLVAPADMIERTDEWRRAYLATPHGQPIELAAERKQP